MEGDDNHTRGTGRVSHLCSLPLTTLHLASLCIYYSFTVTFSVKSELNTLYPWLKNQPKRIPPLKSSHRPASPVIIWGPLTSCASHQGKKLFSGVLTFVRVLWCHGPFGCLVNIIWQRSLCKASSCVHGRMFLHSGHSEHCS